MDIKELNKKIDALTTLIQSDQISKMKLEEMLNNIETKLDVMLNLDTQVKAINNSKMKAFPSKPIWFKEQFSNDNHIFIKDGLYTEEEIAEQYKDKEVEKKKKEADKVMKVGQLLYNIIKNDKDKFAKYTEIYTTAKNEYSTIKDDDDEETKSDS